MKSRRGPATVSGTTRTLVAPLAELAGKVSDAARSQETTLVRATIQ